MFVSILPERIINQLGQLNWKTTSDMRFPGFCISVASSHLVDSKCHDLCTSPTASWGSLDFTYVQLLLLFLPPLLPPLVLLLRPRTPSPPNHVAMSGCEGPGLDPNCISPVSDAVGHAWAWNRMPSRMPDTLPERFQIECQKNCQIKCQKR